MVVKHCAAISRDQIIEGTIKELSERLGCCHSVIYNRVYGITKSLWKGWKIVEAWQPEWRCYSRDSGTLVATSDTADGLSAEMHYTRSWAATIRAQGNRYYRVVVFKRYTPAYYEAVRKYHNTDRMSDEEMEEIAREVRHEQNNKAVQI